ncbi:prepilin-type N-terminal cleavage/methylation domain-containing protein [Lysinibacillus sp. BW-2-10]|uniref:prepilin-type N-terminal cleavage/methylation domain-containing protein n=1 Tax=Lysinibacillus sp. BW-2-10 TaxID=2590030 RepID=UPI00117F55B1|nr:prepilin-type N-terminal cleavage/methylation domain-containing protein [Lysinibacillus sp. BW-2-10]TSI10136.1 hypothetical protein FJQ64_04510 [Lysinibacillus sp. BW-2-10]
MKRFYKSFRLNESGISLVEVIASIVILSIIILSIFSLLTQSSKTTRTSERIIDATYVAQTEMEELYFESIKRADPESAILSKGYTKNTSYFEKTNTSYNFYIKLSLTKNDTYPQLTRILIQVYEHKHDTHPKAQMENTLDWGQ